MPQPWGFGGRAWVGSGGLGHAAAQEEPGWGWHVLACTTHGASMYYANLFSALTHGALDANETLIFITAPKWGANVSGAVTEVRV